MEAVGCSAGMCRESAERRSEKGSQGSGILPRRAQKLGCAGL